MKKKKPTPQKPLDLKRKLITPYAMAICTDPSGRRIVFDGRRPTRPITVEDIIAFRDKQEM